MKDSLLVPKLDWFFFEMESIDIAEIAGLPP
jgi:hypothetical protein